MYETRIKFLVKIQQLFQAEYPSEGVVANLFGSTLSGLYTESSDIDLCLSTKNTTNSPLNNIHIVAKILRLHGMQDIFTISKAKVPICKFYDPEFHLSCDINVNSSMAQRNTLLIKTYVSIDPRARALIMMVKWWAKRRALNDAARGGTLSSYTWSMICINFLQMRSPPILPSLHEIAFENRRKGTAGPPIVIEGVDCSFYDDLDALAGFGSKNEETIGDLLYAFFRHFALEFDYNHSVISVRHGKYLSKIEKGWHEDVERLYRYFCIEEPFNTHRNLGNSVDGITVEGLRREFERAAMILGTGGSFRTVAEIFQHPRVSRYTKYPTNDDISTPTTAIRYSPNSPDAPTHAPYVGNVPAYYQVPFIHPSYYVQNQEQIIKTGGILLNRMPSPVNTPHIDATYSPYVYNQAGIPVIPIDLVNGLTFSNATSPNGTLNSSPVQANGDLSAIQTTMGELSLNGNDEDDGSSTYSSSSKLSTSSKKNKRGQVIWSNNSQRSNKAHRRSKSLDKSLETSIDTLNEPHAKTSRAPAASKRSNRSQSVGPDLG